MFQILFFFFFIFYLFILLKKNVFDIFRNKIIINFVYY